MIKFAPDCDQESCPNWSGDGHVCPCAIFGLERPDLHADERGQP